MLNSNQVELRVHQAVETALSGATSEDSILELKGDFADGRKSARQIAALCNSVVGEDAIWAVGFDERNRKFHPPSQELANWWPQVEKFFDGGVCPRCQNYLLRIDDHPLQILHFQTDQRPFLILREESGDVEIPWRREEFAEVPYRYLNKTRTARRAEILKLFVPTITQPEFSILNAVLTVEEAGSLTATMVVYAVPTGNGRVTIPFYKCRLIIGYGQSLYTIPSMHAQWSSPQGSLRDQQQIILDGPTFFTISTPQVFNTPWPQIMAEQKPELILRIGFAASDMFINIVAPLPKVTDLPNLKHFEWTDSLWKRG